MNSYCVRQGQVEVGVIEHDGHEFAALGATVCGKNLTAYTCQVNRRLVLTTWCGQITLDCRSEVVERYWSGAIAVLFRLTKGRFIAGYALGEEGMLFRGELIADCSDEEARRIAIQISDYFAEIDAEDEAADWDAA